MRKQLAAKLGILWILCLSCLPGAAAQTPAGESPAERRGKELARLLDTGTRAHFRKFVQDHFAPPFRDAPMERHLNFFSTVQDSSRGVEFHSVQDARPNEATLLLRSKLTGQWIALFVRVEPEAPNRIAGIGLRQPRPPSNAQARPLTPQQVAQELGALVKKLADADVFSGTVLLAKDGVPVFKDAYGVANKDFGVPNRLDTKFNLGSMNKMFTSVAIAQLAERGKPPTALPGTATSPRCRGKTSPNTGTVHR